MTAVSIIGGLALIILCSMLSHISGRERGYWQGYENSEEDWHRVLQDKGLIKFKETKWGCRLIWLEKECPSPPSSAPASSVAGKFSAAALIQ